ncbi:hypothetical protein JOY44_00225 [Phormidium sp. CLA17]|uniref:hypothetical protein n=1 Tax=Leptolyngbya sp. Cla-17 TaxID=2803751 RepID=UPI001490FA78|nr:hypothetical protein [Leptolyngbya sp. Cla-17]MBM0740081.1 hypothetical protein [Leptolyngbya sp. Cla-17]
MRQHVWRMGLGLGLAVSMTSAAIAVAPAPVTQNSKVAWSEVVSDRFDGMLVYDKNFDGGGKFVFVSSWAPQGIRATYTEYHSEVVDYKTVWRSKWITEKGKRREVQYRDQEPIYRKYQTDRSPKTIKFAINNQVYTYEQGTVPAELAAALANAPLENMTIRLVWENDATTDIEIGKGTVAAWKTIFKPSAQFGINQPLAPSP